ncbi:MAG: diadenylate cyclase CdaA [Oscillospiraceae bacterium]|nr:diadenylate cyclase CdaA [Oscillospiraceae bacterium]
MFLTTFAEGFEQFKRALFSFDRVSDLLDILLVAFVIYSVIKLIRETRAIQLAKGVILLAIVYLVVTLLDMQASEYIMSFIFGNLLLILVIIFSPEIRHALESVGRSSVSSISFFNFKSGSDAVLKEKIKNSINGVCKACADMSDKKIGALIVFEKETILGEIAVTGTALDAEVSAELIGNIFFPKAPMHDGAAIIKDGRVISAGCILPLTSNIDVSSELGTRHRAAIGMSESSDALVVVVSEETGAISVAEKGRLRRNISDGDLREILMKSFVGDDTKQSGRIKKIFRGSKNEKE